MVRKLELIDNMDKPVDDADTLRWIWLTSGRQPPYIVRAVQSHALVSGRNEASWRLEVLSPHQGDENGIPTRLRLLGHLYPAAKLSRAFNYAGMMERLHYNYNPGMFDPLSRSLNYYDDERKRFVRGQASSGNPEVSPSLSSEAWARRALI